MIQFLTKLIAFEGQRSGAFPAPGHFYPVYLLPRSNTYSGGAGAAKKPFWTVRALFTGPVRLRVH